VLVTPLTLLKVPHNLRADANQPPVVADMNQLLRFAATGLIGTLAHFTVLTAMVEVFNFQPTVASTMGFVVGASVNYLGARRWVFVSSASHARTLPRFLLIAFATMWLNLAIVWFGVEILNLHYFVTQILATGIAFVANYVLNKLWAFRVA
jgi:putative flippase GtrA